ncbi:RHS repeat domain-containing protein [Undibacterium flavidum]|uniref:RHS repeat protein n=1 Tax=Undibacterium flavidum TaxID=2762297 RepID=A0ABR6YEE0_9BURK|nr:RHS repeat domain-containing protein [Undibacterium flavidum]MBC3874902.1 RHS repeat protein [Undibacterium flavidum]
MPLSFNSVFTSPFNIATKRSSGLTLVLTALLMSANVASAQTPSIYSEQSKLIKAPNAVSRLGADLFGDKVNLYNGGLEFTQTDFNLKGNSALPVSVGRRLTIGRSGPSGLFGRWDMEIPHLHGVFARADSWTSITGSASPAITNQRCSTNFGAPRESRGANLQSDWAAKEFWGGNFIYIPGVGDQEMLRRNTLNGTVNNNVPTGGTYNIVTKDAWAFSCINLQSVSAKANENGEGFLAISPEGTQYRFDWLATRPMANLTKSNAAPATFGRTAAKTPGVNSLPPIVAVSADGNTLYRDEVWILPTRVTDRFGNYVDYVYDTTDKWKLLSISASDGRQVTFTYVAGTRKIQTASDGTRTWTYTYSGGDALTQVTLPDSSAWQLGGIDTLAYTDISYVSEPDCENKGTLSIYDMVGSMTHPSGAVGTFTIRPTVHGRSFVEKNCRNLYDGFNFLGTYAVKPKYFASFSLVNKTISGPGLTNMSWLYNYGTENTDWNASWSDCTGASCLDTKVVKVTDPKGDVTRYTFGNRFRASEGQLLKVESGWNGASALRTVTNRYRSYSTGEYPNPAGYSDQDRGDAEIGARYQPLDQRVTTQQGQTFSWTANQFDNFARQKKVTKTGPSGTRNETTVYEDNLTSKWILGQIKSATDDGSGLVMQQNTYDTTTSTLLTTSRFGLLQETMTYNGDGTLATKKDGLNQTTTLSNYKRGIPQLVTYANSTSESAVVDNIGLVTSFTNGAGTTTTLGYDAMGRLSSVTYPTDAGITWNNTIINFVPVASAEKGIAAGHWRQTVSTGNGQSITYLDALWRPVLTSTYDTADQANTEKSVLSKFDHNGKTTFQSYPQRSIASVATVVNGVTTTYDALGRETQSDANSELGLLTTTTSYLSGFTKRVTNPRNQSTTTAFQAFDEPVETAPTTITAPEGVTVQINRDLFGKTISITRSGNDGSTGTVSATRSYVYDANQRLCKTIEPEVNATIQSYDAANNVTWRATGISSPSTTACDQANAAIAAAKVSFTYDSLNRLLTTSYADGSPNITRTYTNDGLPLTVSSNNAGTPTWTSTYNNRRLLTNESLSFEGNTYNVGRVYNSNGALTNLNYPTQSAIASVDYAPNALGEASKIGSYASNVKYYPNGAVSGFTYGNGIVHTLAQNTRGLPQQSRDVGILNDTYVYDANANVQSITDVQEGLNTRNLTYDNVDRLKTATGYFGNASYTYDSLDNLKISSVGSRSNIHTYNTTTNLLSNISSSDSNFNFAYSYDTQGNIIQRGTQVYAFDKGNRLTSATGKATYSYDGLGHRVKTTNTDGSTQVSVYTPAGQILFTNKTGGTNPGKTSYIYLDRHQIAEVKN